MAKLVSKPLAVRVVQSATPFKVAIFLLVICFFAAQIVVPFVIAVLLAFLLQPVVKFFDRRGVPHSLSCILALLAGAGILLAVFGYAYLQLSNATGQIERWLAKLQSIHEYFLSFFGTAEAGIAREQLFYLQPEFWTRITVQALSSLTYFLGNVLLIMFFVYFLLRDGTVMFARLLVATGTQLPLTHDILEKIDVRIHQYIGTVFLIEAGLSIVIGVVLWAWGVPYPFLWALLSAVLGLIPFVGASIAAVPPVLIALAEFDGYSRALSVLAIYVFLQVMDGKFLTPQLVGRRVHLSPLVILISTVFWGWIWGIIGLLLATPLLVCIKVVAENIPSLYPLSVLLGDSDPLEAPATPEEQTLAPSVPAQAADAEAMAIAEEIQHDGPPTRVSGRSNSQRLRPA